MSQEWIRIRNAQLHCLKGVDLDLPVGKISVITGPSGSGKSTLALGVLHAECRRRYLETLQGQTRTSQIPVDRVEGLRPSMAWEPLPSAPELRYTVSHEIGLESLLGPVWAKLASLQCPYCHTPLEILHPQQMVERIASLPSGSKVQLIAPIDAQGKSLAELGEYWVPQGFLRAWGEHGIWDFSNLENPAIKPKNICLLVDRWVIKEGLRSRIADSLRTALRVGMGAIGLLIDAQKVVYWADHPRCPEHGDLLSKFDASLYSPFSSLGQCAQCQGSGFINDMICPHCLGLRLTTLLRSSSVMGTTWEVLQKQNLLELQQTLQSLMSKIPHYFQRSWEQALERLNVCLQLGLHSLRPHYALAHLADGERQRLRMVNMASGHLDGLLLLTDELGSGLDISSCSLIWPILQKIVARGNTLLMVEHHEAFITQADYRIEMGPGAGELGGEILWQGFSNTRPSSPHVWRWSPSQSSSLHTLVLASQFQFDAQEVQIAHPGLTLIQGSSGSGKSLLLQRLRQAISQSEWMRMPIIQDVRLAQAKRSTLATATGVMDALRDLFASLPEAKIRGLKPKYFSTNTVGGRCESCLGLGTMEDPLGFGEYPCPVCQGKRFRDEVLAVRFKTLNIAEILELPLREIIPLFQAFPLLGAKLKALQNTGLDYLSLGLSTSTLSGGEAQRAALAMDLAKSADIPSIYLMDTPSRGLHPQDLERLGALFQNLIAQGHSFILADNHPAWKALANQTITL